MFNKTQPILLISSPWNPIISQWSGGFCQHAHLEKDSWTDILMYTYSPGVNKKNIAEMETIYSRMSGWLSLSFYIYIHMYNAHENGKRCGTKLPNSCSRISHLATLALRRGPNTSQRLEHQKPLRLTILYYYLGYYYILYIGYYYTIWFHTGYYYIGYDFSASKSGDWTIRKRWISPNKHITFDGLNPTAPPWLMAHLTTALAPTKNWKPCNAWRILDT